MILLDFYVPIDGSIWKGQERPLRTSNLAFTSVWMRVSGFISMQKSSVDGFLRMFYGRHHETIITFDITF